MVFKQRDAVRQTWGARNRYDSVQTVFVVGKTADDTVQMDVQKEIERHGDILYIDSIDSYRNNTRKFIHSILFAFKPGNGCPSPEFLFLVDDDYMVNIGGILRHLSEENRYFHLYEGWMFNTTPFRFRIHKHAVSSMFDGILNMYPLIGNAAITSQPGSCTKLSHNTVAHFYFALQLVRIYPFDDIYAGILAHLLRIRPRHNEAFVFWTRSINADEWKHGNVLAAHGYSPDQLILEYNASIHSA
ncbi:N-acetyllactosaminide 3-alpha-galactosyltransferase [Cooperia oncophora]